jgi:streptomycin 6-kinase
MRYIPQNFSDRIIALGGDTGKKWLGNLPDLIADCEKRWSISVDRCFDDLSYNFIAPAACADGTNAVLKLGMLTDELVFEIQALKHFRNGAVELLESDSSIGALLLQRLAPGTLLSSLEDDDEATRIAAGVMERIWRPGMIKFPFPTVADWASGLERLRNHFEGGTGPLPQEMVENAESLFDELIYSSEEMVLLHGDLHHYNILLDDESGWLAIDPKGLLGEREFEIAQFLYNPIPHFLSMPNPKKITEQRIDIFVEMLSLNRERVLGWGFAKAVLSAWWSIEDNCGSWEYDIECAKILEELM